MQDAGTIEHDFAFRLLRHSWSPKGTSMYFYYWAAFWLALKYPTPQRRVAVGGSSLPR
jgi:hypothetical protein